MLVSDLKLVLQKAARCRSFWTLTQGQHNVDLALQLRYFLVSSTKGFLVFVLVLMKWSEGKVVIDVYAYNSKY